jgi:hypothetical protein
MRKLLLTLGLLLFCGRADAITLVQKAQAEATGGAVSSFNVAYGSAVTSGNELFAWLRVGNSTQTAVTVSDNVNAGNWTLATSIVDSTNGRAIYLFYRENTGAGTPTVTASWSTVTANNDALQVYEYSGLATSNSLDQKTSANPATSTTPSSGSITTTQASELVIGGVVLGSGTLTTVSTESTGFTTQENDTLGTSNHGHLHSADQIVSSTGTFTYQPTLSATEVVCISIASFKASGGAPPPCTNRIALMGAGCS